MSQAMWKFVSRSMFKEEGPKGGIYVKRLLNKESGKANAIHVVILFVFLVIITISFFLIIIDDRKPDKVTLNMAGVAENVTDGIPDAPTLKTELLQPDPDSVENSAPVAQFTATTPVTVGEPVTFEDLSFDADLGDSIVNKHWDGKKDFYNKPGVYTVTLKVQDDQGKWSEPVSHVVHVLEKEQEQYNLPPIAMFKATNPIYVGETVIYEDLSYDPDGGTIADARWEGKQTQFNSPGKYRVTLTVQDDKGKWSDPLYQVMEVRERPLVEVQRKPVAAFTVTSPVYVGQTVTYTNKSFDQDGDSIIATDWSANKKSSYSKPGKYDITLRVQDEHGAWSDTYTKTVQVIDSPNMPPVADFATNSPVHVRQAVTFKNTSHDKDGSIAREQWGGDKRYSYDKAGEYPVTLTVWDNKGAKSSVTKKIVVLNANNQAPIAKFNTNDPVHVGEVVHFWDDSYDKDGKIVKRDWSGDKRTTYSAPGDYKVTLTVTDDYGAKGKFTKTIKILPKENQKPVPLISGPTKVVTNQTVVFRDESYDPDGHIASTTWGSKTLSKTWSEPGVYYVRLEVTDNRGATSVVEIPVYVEQDGYPPKGS